MSGDIKLTGRRLLITGAARGLGEAFARAAVEAGARVVIGDVLHQQGRTLAKEIGADYVDMDVSSVSSIQTAIAFTHEMLGGLDGLLNNAAVTNSGGKAMEQISLDTWDQVMNVNVKGLWQTSVAALPLLRQSGTGRIVNLASDTALWGAPKLLAYTASKGAVISMTKSMARELGPDGISVNALAPGLTLVEATQYVPQERHDYYAQGRAVTRPQLPSDITAAALFLLSASSGFITGQILPVNGGFYMQ